MAKHHILATPFGEVTLTVLPTHVQVAALDSSAVDWGQGWWHGHQGGEEAVFARQFWTGTLGTGSRPSAARSEVDAFVGRWGFTEGLATEWSRLTAAQKGRLEAFAQGFNAGRHRRGAEAPWTPADSLLLGRTLGFLGWWEERRPQIAFLLDSLRGGLAWNQAADLWPALGPEVGRGPWADLGLPPDFSAEAQALVDKIRRFRPGRAWALPATRNPTGRPLLGANFAVDVTEPGLPFLALRLEGPGGPVRGLALPGLPGFLAGRNRTLAWHVAPAVDDTVDLRVPEGGAAAVAVWAGADRFGTLQSLLLLEEASTADQARDRTLPLGSAALDATAVDSRGGWAQWALGPRWLRPSPRDAWLPAPWTRAVPVGPRPSPDGEDRAPAGRLGTADLQKLLGSRRPGQLEVLLAALRFLLPDTDEGTALRRWSGVPEDGPEARTFERLRTTVLHEFWAGAPKAPRPLGPVDWALGPRVDALIQAPHSAWLPSADKNRRLAAAVRLAFAPGAGPGTPVLGRSSVRALWTEDLGARPRILATTVALVVDPGEPGWKVFLTDDETEEPVFSVW